MPTIKNKPPPHSQAKDNKKVKSAVVVPDKKAKRTEKSPTRTPTKKEKNIRSVKNKIHSNSVPNKRRSSSSTDQSKRGSKLNNVNNRVRNKSPEREQDKDKNKAKQKKSLSKKKIPGHNENVVDVVATKSKSLKASRVNTDKHWYSQLESDKNSTTSDSNKKESEVKADVDKRHNSRTTLKRLMRRQVWNMSKGIIKGNEHWRQLMAENRIDIDKINIDAVDLSIIDVEGLGIENKLLKKAVVWLLK